MGYGGFITWTPLIKRIEALDRNCVLFSGNQLNVVHSEIFDRQPNISYGPTDMDTLWFNMANQNCVYLTEHGDRVKWKPEKIHMAARILKEYGFPCDDIDPYFLFLHRDQIACPAGRYIVIEPASKTSFTPNKQYMFEKWQRIVNSLHKDIDFVQVGVDGSRVLDNVISLVGKTSFIQAAWVINNAVGLISSEGGLSHAATAVGTRALVLYTGYMPQYISAYPQNANISISTHDESCGLVVPCEHCRQDREDHDPEEIISRIHKEFL